MGRINVSRGADASESLSTQNAKKNKNVQADRLFSERTVSCCENVKKRLPPADLRFSQGTKPLLENTIELAPQKVEAVREAGDYKSIEFATWQTRLAAVYDGMDARSPGWSDDKRRLTVGSALGSHDSGSYTTKSSRLAPVSVTQTDNLQQQLEGGVRYLDMRIRPSGDRFIINHGVVDGTDCKPELDQVFQFARENPGELVMLKVQLGKDKPNTEPNTIKLHEFYKNVIEPHEDLFIKRDADAEKMSDIKIGDHERQGNILLLIEHRGEGSNPYMVNNFPTCWSYKQGASSTWLNVAGDKELLHKNEELLRYSSETPNRETLFISQYQKTSMTSLHPKSMKSLRHQAKSNVKVAGSVLSAVREAPGTKPNILNTDFVNEYGGERNKYQLMAFNLLGVDEYLIEKHFPECAELFLEERQLIEQAANIYDSDDDVFDNDSGYSDYSDDDLLL